MIAFDFEYYKPTSVDQAIDLFQELRSTNKKTIYYGGGTEYISRARMDEITAAAVIDLKEIPECNVLTNKQNKITIGSAITLTQIADTPLFPLLSNVSRLIATHTARNKITIGGNISSHLFYREIILPFLLSDSKVVIASKDGVKEMGINEIYRNGRQLNEDEFIIQLITDSKFSQFPHFNHKKTKHSKINYPIVSIASLLVEDQIRIAFSGVCAFPFRLEQIEYELNDSSGSFESRINNIMNHMPGPILNDMHASVGYRKFVLQNVLMEILEQAREVS